MGTRTRPRTTLVPDAQSRLFGTSTLICLRSAQPALVFLTSFSIAIGCTRCVGKIVAESQMLRLIWLCVRFCTWSRLAPARLAFDRTAPLKSA
jgi:hypothetical protein